MIRTFFPPEGANGVEFAARGQAELVVVPAEGLRVETHEPYEREVLDEGTGEVVGHESVMRPINADLLSALEAHESVVEGETQPSLFETDNDPED